MVAGTAGIQEQTQEQGNQGDVMECKNCDTEIVLRNGESFRAITEMKDGEIDPNKTRILCEDCQTEEVNLGFGVPIQITTDQREQIQMLADFLSWLSFHKHHSLGEHPWNLEPECIEFILVHGGEYPEN
jgi:hypothetical protein